MKVIEKKVYRIDELPDSVARDRILDAARGRIWEQFDYFWAEDEAAFFCERMKEELGLKVEAKNVAFDTYNPRYWGFKDAKDDIEDLLDNRMKEKHGVQVSATVDLPEMIGFNCGDHDNAEVMIWTECMNDECIEGSDHLNKGQIQRYHQECDDYIEMMAQMELLEEEFRDLLDRIEEMCSMALEDAEAAMDHESTDEAIIERLKEDEILYDIHGNEVLEDEVP